MASHISNLPQAAKPLTPPLPAAPASKSAPPAKPPAPPPPAAPASMPASPSKLTKPVPKLSLQKQDSVDASEQNPRQQPAQPQTASYATVAAVPEGYGFTVDLPSKKKKRGTQMIRPPHDPNDQKVVAQIHPNTPARTDLQSTWRCLQVAYKVVNEYRKDLDFCFVGCHVMSEQNIVLQISSRTRATDYIPHLDAIRTTLTEEAGLNISFIDGEPRWVYPK